MKVVFSRKGWDSGFGGKPSPIFPDGTLQSLPIACDPGSPHARQIAPSALSAKGFSDLGAFIRAYHPRSSQGHTHLDPDLDASAFPRADGWFPCFGQDDQAASHLDTSGVGIDDLFLFYGWFDDVTRTTGGWMRSRSDRFVIWGWLQIGQIFAIPHIDAVPAWLRYHPHVVQTSSHGSKNRIYVASPTLRIANETIDGRSGGGVFGCVASHRTLTRTPGRRGLYPDHVPSWLQFSKFRQEHIWSCEDPVAVTYLRDIFR
jgi:hypothetical protein